MIQLPVDTSLPLINHDCDSPDSMEESSSHTVFMVTLPRLYHSVSRMSEGVGCHVPGLVAVTLLNIALKRKYFRIKDRMGNAILYM